MEPEIQYLKNIERCAAASGSEPNLQKKRMSPAWAPTLQGSRTRNPLPGVGSGWEKNRSRKSGAARDKVRWEPPGIRWEGSQLTHQYIYICKETTLKKRQIKQCGYITMCISHCILLQSTALDQAKKLIKLVPHPPWL